MEETSWMKRRSYLTRFAVVQRLGQSSAIILRVALWMNSFFTENFDRQILHVVVRSSQTFSDQLFLTSGQKIKFFLINRAVIRKYNAGLRLPPDQEMLLF